MARHAAAAAGNKSDILAHDAAAQIGTAVANFDLAFDFLKFLLQVEFQRRVTPADIHQRLPFAGNAGRHHIGKQVTDAGRADLFLGDDQFALLVGIPFTEVVVMGHDACARPQRHELGAQPEVHFRQQVGADHGRPRQVGGKQVFLDETHLVGNAGLLRILVGEFQQVGIEIDTESTGAVLGGRGDDEAAVTGTEVDQEILGADFRHLQHGIDDNLRRRHIHHVATAFLRGRRQRQCAHHQHCTAQYFRHVHACHFHHRSLIGLPTATCRAAAAAPYMPLMLILPVLTRSARHGNARSPLRSTTSPVITLPSMRLA